MPNCGKDNRVQRTCAICSEPFLPSKYRPDQRVCRNADCRREARKQVQKAWREKNADYWKQWKRETKDASRRWRDRNRTAGEA